jgi:hypothetical protein
MIRHIKLFDLYFTIIENMIFDKLFFKCHIQIVKISVNFWKFHEFEVKFEFLRQFYP